jgi:methylmalonyl-CoA mutase
MSVTSPLPTAAGFPAADRAQWQRMVAGVLAKSGTSGISGLEGAAAEEALSTLLEDGVRVQPLYTAEDLAAHHVADPGVPGSAPYVRGYRARRDFEGWDIRVHHADPDPARTHEAVLGDLENGAHSLWFALGDGGIDVDALPVVLDGVFLDLAGVVLDAGAEFGAAAARLFALHAERGAPERAVSGNLGADPLGLLARTGRDAATGRLLEEACGLARRCADRTPGIRALTVDALVYHDAGASCAQELGSALATAIGYLRALTSAGLPLSTAAAQIEFRYAASADQFATIAKLRAARRLWARVLEACGDASAAGSGRAHAVTSSVMMTERDPWVNMLRTTVAALAAGVGGAEALTVSPFDDAVGLPDESARRIARNAQSILLEESHLGRVLDPAGGSWYVEALTDSLARATWAWLQTIERAGGQHAALTSGLIASRIDATWREREGRLARRSEPITGVSEFPNLAETPLARPAGPQRASAPDHAAVADGASRPASSGGGLPRVRRAAQFEALRTRSDRMLAETGARPKIVLVALGPEAVTSARSSFAANLFQAGGIETALIRALIDSDPDSASASGLDTDALAKAVAASGASCACLCSSDAGYAAHAASAARAVADAGIGRIWLAGRPGEQAAAYRAAGVTDFVYVGCDAVAALSAAFGQDQDAHTDEPESTSENGSRR